jgi:hypothetical protein
MKIVLSEKECSQIIAEYFYTDIENVELILFDNNSDTAHIEVEVEIKDDFVFKKIKSVV